MNVTKMVGLGAYPFGAPHTRPVGITATSADPAVITRLDLSKSTLDAPAGVQSLLEHTLFERNIQAVSLWAQVPHYVASMAYPLASAALLQAVSCQNGCATTAPPLANREHDCHWVFLLFFSLQD